jgi:hypothetical protein
MNLGKRQMNLIALYLTSAIPKPAPLCIQCVQPHTIKGSYIDVAYCTVCNYPMNGLTKRYIG